MCVCVCVYVHSCVCDYSCVSEKTFFVVMIRVKKIVNRELYTMADVQEDVTWYPKQKVQFAARKLKGDNPCYITR